MEVAGGAKVLYICTCGGSEKRCGVGGGDGGGERGLTLRPGGREVRREWSGVA